MAEVATATTAEQIRTPERRAASQLSKLYIGLGELDTSKRPTKDKFNEVDDKSKQALQKQTNAIRKADEEKVTAFIQDAERKAQVPDEQKRTPQAIRHEYFITWSHEAVREITQQMIKSQRKLDLANVYKKLGITLNPAGTNEGADSIINLFYNEQTHQAGTFYKTFCGTDMTEKLAAALTVDEMYMITDFLTRWMVGTDDLFHALVLRRECEKDKGNQLTPEATLPENEKPIVTIFKEGDEKTEDELVQKYRQVRGVQPSQQAQPAPGSELQGTAQAKVAQRPSTEGREQTESRVQLQPELREELLPLMNYINEGLDLLQRGIDEDNNKLLKDAIDHFSGGEIAEQFQITSIPGSGESHPVDHIVTEDELKAAIYDIARHARPGEMPPLPISPMSIIGKFSSQELKAILDQSNEEAGIMTLQPEVFRPDLKRKLYIEFVRLTAEEWIHEMQDMNEHPIYVDSQQYDDETDIAAYFYVQGLDLNGDFDFMHRYPGRMQWYEDMRQQYPDRFPKDPSDLHAEAAKPLQPAPGSQGSAQAEVAQRQSPEAATSPLARIFTAEPTQRSAEEEVERDENRVHVSTEAAPKQPSPETAIIGSQRIEQLLQSVTTPNPALEALARVADRIDGIATQDLQRPMHRVLNLVERITGDNIYDLLAGLTPADPSLSPQRNIHPEGRNVSQETADAVKAVIDTYHQQALANNTPVIPSKGWNHCNFARSEETAYRIYLNPDLAHFDTVLSTLYKMTKTDDLYFKTYSEDAVTPNELQRLDNAVLYVRKDNADAALAKVEAFAKQHPEIFAGRLVPGSSELGIADGIGIARDINGNNVSAGERNAAFIKNQLLSSLSLRETGIKHMSNADWLKSREYQILMALPRKRNLSDLDVANIFTYMKENGFSILDEEDRVEIALAFAFYEKLAEGKRTGDVFRELGKAPKNTADEPAGTSQQTEPTEQRKGFEKREPTDPYYPISHKESQFVAPDSQGWEIVGNSLRGLSHEHDAKYREDAVAIASANGWHLVAVADGGGSYSLSRVGADIAVKQAIGAMKQLAQTNLPTTEEELRKILLQGVQTAYKAVQLQAVKSQAELGRPVSVKDLRSTLLLLVHHQTPDGKHLVGSLQIGDGCIVGRDEEGKLHRLSKPDIGPTGNETMFLPDVEAEEWQNRISIDNTMQGPNCYFMAMTDGISDDFEPVEQNLYRLEQPFFNIIQENKRNPQAVSTKLTDLLSYERRGSFDDRTFACLFSENKAA